MGESLDTRLVKDQVVAPKAAASDGVDASLESWAKQYPMPDEIKGDPTNDAKMLYQ